jgi:hypothetical protein
MTSPGPGYNYVALRELRINNVIAFEPGQWVPDTTIATQGWSVGTHVSAPGVVVPTPQLLTTPMVAAPSNTSTQWQSSSLLDMRIPADASGRVQIIKPTLPSEGNDVAEPSLWWDGSRWNLTYSATTTINLAYCPGNLNPMAPANWTKIGPILGKYSGTTYGGVNAANRSAVYIEGNTTYLVFTDGANVRIASAASSNLAAWTDQGILFTPATNPGNQFLIKDGATYYLFSEYASGGGWQTAVYTASAVTGPYTQVLATVASLQPFSGSSVSGIWIGKEGSTFVAYFHSGPFVSLPTSIYRATTTSLTTDSWTIDNQALPVVRRAAPYEVDQVADPFIARSPGSVTYMVWDCMDNTPGVALKGSIAITAMRPIRKLHDGAVWQAVDTHDDRAFDLLERFPPIIQIVPWMGDPSQSVGTWAAVVDPTVPGNAYYRNTSAALHDQISWDVMLQPGTYDLTVVYKPGTNAGQISAYLGLGISPVSSGWPSGNPLEGYSASPPAFASYTWPNYTITGTEVVRRILTLRVNGQNASSTGFLANLIAVQLRRTDH